MSCRVHGCLTQAISMAGCSNFKSRYPQFKNMYKTNKLPVQNATKYHISDALTSSQASAVYSRSIFFLTSEEFYMFTFRFLQLHSLIFG